MPTASCRSRHGWLKKTRFSSPVSSSTTASTIFLRWRVGRDETRFTSATIVASSPGTSSAISALRVRSW